MPHPVPRLAATLLLAGVAACGGGNGQETTGTMVVIRDFAFEAPSEVAVGTTVTATNEDAATHTWSAVDGTFDSGQLAQGDTFTFTFDEPGTYDYLCRIHPSMTGGLTVTG